MSILGMPVISLALNIVPEFKLFSIESNCPEEDSKETVPEFKVS
jgi:hypothetical protein